MVTRSSSASRCKASRTGVRETAKRTQMSFSWSDAARLQLQADDGPAQRLIYLV